MKTFNLPDLGEGLPDAIIREWYVSTGDTVKADQPLVAMETAKALVDVPAPYAGVVETLGGEVGDTINTGELIVGFEGQAEAVAPKSESHDTAPATGVATAPATGSMGTSIKASPAVRALAKRAGLDLATVTPTGPKGIISKTDVQAAIDGMPAPAPKVAANGTKLSPMQRAMAMAMTKSHETVVPVTLMDDADISHWDKNQKVTIRVIRAVQAACNAVPLLNAHFNDDDMIVETFNRVNLGLAMDTEHGLFVPVLKDIANQSDDGIKSEIKRLKELALNKAMSPDEQKGATIVLSNFGAIAGKYANPVVTPPMTAIVGVGKLYERATVENGELKMAKTLPLCVTVDHRAVTGGEVARFLGAMIEALK